MTTQRKQSINPISDTDEGWWTSVLAEESHHSDVPAHRIGANPQVRHEATEKHPEADWKHIRDLYLQDQIIELIVNGHNRGGLLVEGNDLQGFVPFSHIVELAGKSETDREDLISTYMGRTLKLKVIECTPEDGRVVFSERAAQSEAGKRTALFDSIHLGDRLKGQVTNITDFGVFIDLGGVEGLIHISELSWGQVPHPNQIVKMGQTLEVKVLDISTERCRVALSLKQLQPNPWNNANENFPAGSILNATITTVLSYGAFARLASGVEGLIHSSEIPHQENQTVKDILKEGQTVEVKIMHVDADHQRMGFTMLTK